MLRDYNPDKATISHAAYKAIKDLYGNTHCPCAADCTNESDRFIDFLREMVEPAEREKSTEIWR